MGEEGWYHGAYTVDAYLLSAIDSLLHHYRPVEHLHLMLSSGDMLANGLVH